MIAYLGLGSSLGDRRAHLETALHHLEAPGSDVQVLAVSPVYQSPHMGLLPGDETKYPPHLNCAAKITTTLTPLVLLEQVQRIEEAGQRRRDQRWGPRTIDIDILLYGDTVLDDPRLRLPHPGIAERAFVLRPLIDLDPDLRLPDGRTLQELEQAQALRSQALEWYGTLQRERE